MSSKFNLFILVCIVLNSICLSITWYGQPDSLFDAMELINLVFTLIYTIEMFIKLIAFKKYYFNDGWNNFDFLIVLTAWIGLISGTLFEY